MCKLASERDAPAGAKINQCVSVPRYRAEARGYSAETWDFYAQAHAPLLEDHDRVAHLAELRQDVRGDENRLPAVGQRAHELAQLDASAGIEPGGRLVG